MGSKSKPKGGRGEREVCKIMADVFSGSFIRSANSGAYVGGSNRFRKETLSEGQVKGLKGDIVPPDFMPRFVIECKLYKDFTYHQFVAGEPIAQLDEWIEQTLDCVDPGDFWMLAFRADRRQWAGAILWSEFEQMTAPPMFISYTGGDGVRYAVFNLDQFVQANRDAVLARTK